MQVKGFQSEQVLHTTLDMPCDWPTHKQSMYHWLIMVCLLGPTGEVLAILFFNLDDEQLAYLQSRPGYAPNQDLVSVADKYSARPQTAYDLLDGVSPALQVPPPDSIPGCGCVSYSYDLDTHVMLQCRNCPASRLLHALSAPCKLSGAMSYSNVVSVSLKPGSDPNHRKSASDMPCYILMVLQTVYLIRFRIVCSLHHIRLLKVPS